MKFIPALGGALAAQLDVVERIEPSALSHPSPCAGWTVRDVLQHSLGVTTKFTTFARAETDRPRTPTGDLIGSDYRATMRSVAADSSEAWRTVALHRRCGLPFGEFSADEAAGINLFDALAHTWDIAVGARLVLACPDNLWATGFDAAQVVIGSERDEAHYGRMLSWTPQASARERFLAFLGRSPQ